METQANNQVKFITTDELQKQLEEFADELGKSIVEKQATTTTTTTTTTVFVILLLLGVFNSGGEKIDIGKIKQTYDLPTISIPYNPLELSTLC